jgi:large subunit ribosomal protein L4
MTSIELKTINFNQTGNSETSLQTFQTAYNLEVESPESVAYTIRWQLARRRSGSAKTKTMAEISGTTAKPYKQKGTGRARQGSRRSVQFVGGRTCHGPMPRSFDFSMPKKIVKKALADVLKSKLKENKVMLFSSDFTTEGAKTSKIAAILENKKISSALFLYDSSSRTCTTFARVLRNLKHIKALDIAAINVYDIVKFDQLIIDSNVFENRILGVL